LTTCNDHDSVMTTNEWALPLLYIEKGRSETAFGGCIICKTDANEVRHGMVGLNAEIMKGKRVGELTEVNLRL